MSNEVIIRKLWTCDRCGMVGHHRLNYCKDCPGKFREVEYKDYPKWNGFDRGWKERFAKFIDRHGLKDSGI